jgi:hypothetical protein
MKRKTRILALVSGLMVAAVMFIGCTVDVHDNPTSAELSLGTTPKKEGPREDAPAVPGRSDYFW